MRVRMKLVGGREIRGKVRRLANQVEGAMATATEAAALPLENAWKENIRAYPLIETGSYMRSVHHEVEESGAGHAVVLVGSDIVDPPYPFFLEFGTSRMEPKPTARPALDESQDAMRREYSEAMQQLMASI